MPISYHIDPERRLVCTRASGILTDDELLRHKRALMSDPQFGSGVRELSDTREVAELRVFRDPDEAAAWLGS